MDWEPSGNAVDRLMIPKHEKIRSLSTSTPIVSVQGSGKLFRSHSVSLCSSNDSGLGDSISNVSGTDCLNTPTFNLYVSSSSEIDKGTEASVCQTPQTATCETTLCGRYLEFSFSPVLKHKNFISRRSFDSDLSFGSDSAVHDETISDESVPYLSRLNSDSLNNDWSTAEQPVPLVPKLNLDSDIDSPVQNIQTSKLDIEYVSSCGTAFASTSKGQLSPEFEAVLKQFMPEERDRLIGPRMGRDHVDILTELQARGMDRLLSIILQYLDATDLCSLYRVSESWQRILENDNQATRRRKDFMKRKRKIKPEFHGKENLRKKSPSPQSRNVTGAGVLQALGNLQLENPSSQVTPERHKTRLDLFVEASKLLKSDEKLQKCPKCCKPAKVLPVQERGICLQADCEFDYCIKCCNDFHSSRPCVPVALKRAKTDTVGTKKSKKNLKRL